MANSNYQKLKLPPLRTGDDAIPSPPRTISSTEEIATQEYNYYMCSINVRTLQVPLKRMYQLIADVTAAEGQW